MYLDGKMGLTSKIKQAMFNVAKEYVYIGFLLDEANRYEHYKENGYDSIYDYALQELEFKRSSVKNFIAVFHTFALEDKYGKKMAIKNNFANFKYSQLCEMLSLSEVQRKQITPDMTVKQIRQMKKEDPSGQTSGQLILFDSKNTVSAKLSNRVYNKLRDHAASSGLSFDAIIESALDNFLITFYDEKKASI